MQDFTIALVAHDSPVGKTQQNLKRTEHFARKAEAKGADLICFPELNITGHAGHSAMVAGKEAVPDGPSTQAMIDLAIELDAYFSFGIAEDEHGVPYNTQVIVGPEGYLGKQRKVHLSGDEYYQFRGGTDLPVVELPFAKVGTIICYDNSFPEMARCLALDGAELLLAPHAARFGKWPTKTEDRRKAVKRRKNDWKLVHACRAYDNGCYVGACNTSGRSSTHIKGVEANHAGACTLFSPSGQVIAESRTRDIMEEMIVADLNADAVARRPSNVQQRRPDVFGAIVRKTN